MEKEVAGIDKVGEIDFVLKKEEMSVKMHVFLVHAWKGEVVETEEMRPGWFNPDEIPYQQMWESDSEWLPIILRGKKIKARYTYVHEGGEVETREVSTAGHFTHLRK